MTLKDRRQRFVEEYLVDLNATQAAIRAGYSAKTAYSQGQRLLKDVEVQAAIQRAQQSQSQRTLITADEVLQGLKAEATRMGEGSSHGARVAAWTALGKHLALFVDRQRNESGVILEVTEELVDAGHAGATKQDRKAPSGPG